MKVKGQKSARGGVFGKRDVGSQVGLEPFRTAGFPGLFCDVINVEIFQITLIKKELGLRSNPGEEV